MNRSNSGVRWIAWVGLSVALAVVIGFFGCHRDSAAPFPDWIPPKPPATSGGAFSAYRQIGIETEAAVRGIQPRAAPTAAEIKLLDARLAPFLARVEQANHLRVTDEYVPEATLEPDAARIGWVYLGRGFARRVKAAVAVQDYDKAVTDAIAGTRFALVIACGDASDTLVGLPIADEIRRALTPALRDFTPAQLSKLASGVTTALFDQLPPQSVASHEHAAMDAAIQAVQNAYRDDMLKPLKDQLGPTVRESIDTLTGYRGRAESKRVAFFAAMADEADAEANWLDQAFTTPPAKRTPEPNPKVSSKRPWSALARQFILAGGPMVAATDLTLTRTRLLAITAQLLAVAKTSGAAPHDLSTFPRQLNTDPFTGRSFYYVPAGLDFRLYSAGPDGIDDGGQQDDVTLEGFE